MIRCPRCKSHLSPSSALPLGKKKQTTSFKSSRPTTSPHPSRLKSTKNRRSSIQKSHRDYTIWKYFVDKLTLIFCTVFDLPPHSLERWVRMIAMSVNLRFDLRCSHVGARCVVSAPGWKIGALSGRLLNRGERVSCTDMLSQLFARLQSVNKLTVVKLFTDWKEIKEASWTWALSNQVEPPWSSFSDFLENVTYCSNFTPSSYNFE